MDRDRQTHRTYVGYMGVIVLRGSGRLYVVQTDYSTRRQKAATFSAVFPKLCFLPFLNILQEVNAVFPKSFCSRTRLGFEK